MKLYFYVNRVAGEVVGNPFRANNDGVAMRNFISSLAGSPIGSEEFKLVCLDVGCDEELIVDEYHGFNEAHESYSTYCVATGANVKKLYKEYLSKNVGISDTSFVDSIDDNDIKKAVEDFKEND